MQVLIFWRLTAGEAGCRLRVKGNRLPQVGSALTKSRGRLESVGLRTRSYSRPPVCTAKTFSAISSFVMAAPISGCSPIFCCSVFKIW
jgi:hypothetical protein